MHYFCSVLFNYYTMIRLEGITFGYNKHCPVLEGFNIEFKEGGIYGLLGKNGTGKSTLMSILAGKEGYEEGEMIFRNDIRVGYLEQTPSYPTELSVMEACFWHGSETTEAIADYENYMEQISKHPAAQDNKRLEAILSKMDQLKAWDYERYAKQILTKLKITDFDQRISQLSGGQLKRVALANVLINEPDLLILDEPTNHLDLEMIEWLEKFLSRTTMSILMVTHDRYFLDRICTSIIEMDDHRLYSYDGNYSYYREKKAEEAREAEEAAAERAAQEAALAKKAAAKAKQQQDEVEKAALQKATAQAESRKQAQLGAIQKMSEAKRTELIQRTEAEIAMAEAELKMLEHEMNDVSLQADPAKSQEIAEAYAAKEQEIQAKYEKWEQLTEA